MSQRVLHSLLIVGLLSVGLGVTGECLPVAPSTIPSVITDPAITGSLMQGQATRVIASCVTKNSNGVMHAVEVDLSAIGGSAAQALTFGNDNQWSWQGLLTPPNSGTQTITFTAIDSSGQAVDATLQVEVAAFSLSALAGTWDLHGITAGDAQSYSGWGYGVITITADGDMNWDSVVRSSGDTSLPPTFSSWDISPSGQVTVNGSDWGGMRANADKNILVGATTDGGGGNNFAICIKRTGVTFSQSDLVGTWDMNGLICKSGWGTWLYGTVEADAATASWTEAQTAQGAVSAPHDLSYIVSPAGIISTTDGSHGVMNSDKDLFVTVIGTQRTGYTLCIGMKRGETVFSDADSVGTWSILGLTAGARNLWLFGMLSQDVTGAGWMNAKTSDGPFNQNPWTSPLWTVSPGGIMTGDQSGPHGRVHNQKDLLVGTAVTGDPTASPGIFVGIKQSDIPQ